MKNKTIEEAIDSKLLSNLINEIMNKRQINEYIKQLLKTTKISYNVAFVLIKIVF